MLSCSKESDEDSLPEHYIKIDFNGKSKISSEVAIKQEGKELTLYNYGQTDIFLIAYFDPYGNIKHFAVEDMITGEKKSITEDFRERFFDFSIEIDSINGIIKGDFKGKIFGNYGDITASSSNIIGSFRLPLYIEPELPLGNFEYECSTRMNGKNWICTNEPFSRSSDLPAPFYPGTSHKFYGSDENVIMIDVPYWSGAASYNFQPSDQSKAQLFKYNTTSNSYDEYMCTGTLTVTSANLTQGSPPRVTYIGTFNFTAVNPQNPNDIITVTNGNFQFPYSF